MISIEIVAISFFLNLIIALIVAKDARKWSMDGFTWFIVAFLFPILGVVIYLLSRNPLDNPKLQPLPSYFQEDLKKCLQCAEMVKVDARICRYCGTEFSDYEKIEINKELPLYRSISTEKAEVYNTMNNRGEVVKVLENGEEIKIVGINGEFGEWLEIDFKNGRGFILKYDVE